MPRRRKIRELAVWANGAHVGDWRLPGRGAMEFQYAASWRDSPESRPLSLSLPITGALTPLTGAVVEAYFENLLPDNESIRRRLQSRFHTESTNAFELLAHIGRDCVGAVQILPSDETPADIRRIDARPLTDDEVAAALTAVTSPYNALTRDEDTFRISIAGAQEKTAFLAHQGKWCRPVGSTPSTHIFKLPLGLVGNRLADMRISVENEWLCAQIASAYGLPVADCRIGVFGDRKALIVQRFDRHLHSSGKFWLRFMQEDFAQATGTPWQRKYQADGGPGLIDVARILRGSIDPGRDIATVFRAQLLFYLLAATDGHAKNFSLRLLAGSRFQLTPLYDILSVWPVIGRGANEIALEKARLAMALPGERQHYRLAVMQRRHFETLGGKMGLGAATKTVIDEMLASTPKVIRTVSGRLPKGFPPTLAERIFKGMSQAASRLSGSG